MGAVGSDSDGIPLPAWWTGGGLDAEAAAWRPWWQIRLDGGAAEAALLRRAIAAPVMPWEAVVATAALQQHPYK